MRNLTLSLKELLLCQKNLFGKPGPHRSTSPEGQDYPNVGCFLEIIENKKLVWTNTLLPGFRPAPAPEDSSGFHFTGVIALESHPQGTKYTATVTHGDEESCRKHYEMGFYEGWSLALDQLVVMVKNIR